MAHLTSIDLEAKVSALTGDLTVLDEERGRLSLQAQEGVLVAERAFVDLSGERKRLLGEIEQARLALQQAQRREEAEVRAEVARQEAKHIDGAREDAIALRAAVSRFDNQLADLARTTLEISDLRHALTSKCGGVSSNDPVAVFSQRVVSHVNSALATRGFDFKHMPFVGKDAAGRTDLASLALLPHLPGVSYFEKAAQAAYRRQYGVAPASQTEQQRAGSGFAAA